MLQSPLNYTGGKYRLLPQILPLFPEKINTFVDLFCGGCNVGINAESRRVIYNDLNCNLAGLYNSFKKLDREYILSSVYDIIEKYGFSLTSSFGYKYYGCESSGGLSAFNREPFLRLRADFNGTRPGSGPASDDRRYIMLYVLIVYSFNNQLRFNSRGEFNLPVGKRDFNRKMEKKLSDFIDRIHGQDCSFTCRDFRELDVSGLGPQDFVYADPPYLITRAAYNEQGGWNESAEKELLFFLDGLHSRGLRFALSNVLRSKGRDNRLLTEWLEKNAGRYRAVPLDYSYSNSSYQTKNRTSVSEEVLIVNY